jgi:hypothetical protein
VTCSKQKANAKLDDQPDERSSQDQKQSNGSSPFKAMKFNP